MREIILGLIQGLTEFLPISSSGHLALIQNFYHGLPDADIILDILLHLGTLFVVFIYYRREIWAILRAGLSYFSGSPAKTASAQEEMIFNRKMIPLLLIGTIPTGIIGVGLKSTIEESFTSLPLIAICLLLTGIVLFLSETIGPSATKQTFSYRDALIIGTVQGIAIFPGISRSGSTISAGILLGIDRPLAAQFSFLLSIPAILGAVVLEAKDIIYLTQMPNFFSALLGMLVAFISGYFAITTLIKVVIKRKLFWFSFYCWIVGGSILLYSFLA